MDKVLLPACYAARSDCLRTVGKSSPTDDDHPEAVRTGGDGDLRAKVARG